MVFTMVHTAPEGIGQLELHASEWRVLMQVLAATSAETHDSRIGATEIARNLGIAQPNASRALAALVERRVLLRLGRAKYRVNTHIAYRGSAEDWGQAYYTDPEPVWSTS